MNKWWQPDLMSPFCLINMHCISTSISAQALLFSVHRGPFKEDFYQCVDILGYPSPAYKKLYNIFCMIIQFFLPLTLMIIAYGLIFFTISRKSKEFGGKRFFQFDGIRK